VPAVPPFVPAPLAGVIDRCLAKEPGDRYQRGGEVGAALEAAASGQAEAAWPSAGVSASGSPGARRPLPVSDVVTAVPDTAWQRVEWATGAKGPLAAGFVACRVRPVKSRDERWLLCERSLTTDEPKYYLLNLDEAASLLDLVTIVRSRWPIEQQYRELKDELGFDHFEGRTYRGWTHHTVLTATAFTFLQVERRREADGVRPTLPTVRFWVREIMGVLYIINTRRVLNLIESFRRNPPLQR